MNEQITLNLNVNVDALKDFRCVCGSDIFLPTQKIKLLPPKLSTNTCLLLPSTTVVCITCGEKINIDNIAKDTRPPITLLPGRNN